MKHYIYILVGLALSLSACIYDNLDDCPPVDESIITQIKFLYDEAKEMETIPANELHTAMLYVFDLDNRLVAFSEIKNPRLNDMVYDDLFVLKPEKYLFVVWFNPQPPYFITPTVENLIKGTTLKNDGLFSLTIPPNRLVSSGITLPRSLYGREEKTIVNSANNLVEIPVYQNTNRINISVKGLLPTNHTYRFAITDNNGVYTFDNDLAVCPPFSYTSDTHYTEEKLSTSLTVLRLVENRPTEPVLTIEDLSTGEFLFPGSINVTNNLIEIIRTIYPGNDFSKRHVYDIDIEFRGAEIWINGWKLVSADVELTPW